MIDRIRDVLVPSWSRRVAAIKARRAERTAPPIAPESLSVTLAPWRRAGWAVIAVFIGGSVVWAANAQLDGAAIASGVVGVETKRKTIQHLEGGIIKEILVDEGDEVEAGQVLIRFDDTYPRAALQLLRDRHAAALALRARLIAERDGEDDIEFPDALMQQADNPTISELMLGQVDVLKARRSRIDGQESVLRERIKKHRREITGLAAQVKASEEQLALIEEELRPVAEMAEKGVVSRAVLLALKRKKAAIIGDIGEYRAQIARAEKSITEVQLQLRMLEAKDHNQVTEQLQTVAAEISDLEDKIAAASDRLRRTDVTAPLAGVVVGLQVHTIGGVVQPGHDLLDLVPDRDRLVVDVRIDPKDIDVVYAGMPTHVRLSAFNARTTPMLEAVVASVAADRMTDAITGEPYFAAKVVPAAEFAGFDVRRLKPGMQAEVFLITAERTALDYMVEPLVRSFARAGREQ